MPTEFRHVPFDGGLILSATPVSSPAGSLGQCQNFEVVYGQQGYRRIDGHAAQAAVAGTGAILGGAVFRGEAYCVRNVDADSATLYKLSGGSWSAVQTGLYPGGTWRFIVHTFTGSSADDALYGVDGRNRLIKYDGTTVTQIAPMWGSQATSLSTVAIGTGAKVFTVVESARSWQTGDELVLFEQGDASRRMVGTVTSYVDPTLTMDITSTVGSGSPAAWDIGRNDFTDQAFDLIAHKQHMMLAFPYGQLQTSNVGDPLTYTTSAALFGLGDSLTGFAPASGGLLAVFCENSTHLLYGSSYTGSDIWAMQQHSQNSGARQFTAVQAGANPVFLDSGGIFALETTAAYGDFALASLSEQIKTLLDSKIDTIIFAKVIKGKGQVRFYVSSGEAITMTLLGPKRGTAFTRSVFPYGIACGWSGEDANGDEVQYLGTDDGQVLLEDSGTSFAGASILSFFRTAFHAYKSPAQRKRFRKLTFELSATEDVTATVRQTFDYDAGEYQPGALRDADASGVGGAWTVDDWDAFALSAPAHSRAELNVAGVGRDMALLISHDSAVAAPFSVQAVSVHYTPLGLYR